MTLYERLRDPRVMPSIAAMGFALAICAGYWLVESGPLLFLIWLACILLVTLGPLGGHVPAERRIQETHEVSVGLTLLFEVLGIAIGVVAATLDAPGWSFAFIVAISVVFSVRDRRALRRAKV